MLWIVDGGMISLPVIARVEDFKEDSFIEITGADENHEWKSEPTRYEVVTHCKDCKWWDRKENSNYGYCHACKHGHYSEHWEIQIYRTYKDDWFCADGERKQ